MASNSHQINRIRDLLRNRPPTTSRGSTRGRVPTFSKDVILLEGPDVQNVPRQRRRFALHNARHILQSVDIPKTMTAQELSNFLTNLFVDKLLGISCDIMVAVGQYVAIPNLVEGQELTALNLQKVLKGSASVYLRPNREIQMSERESDDLPDLQDELEPAPHQLFRSRSSSPDVILLDDSTPVQQQSADEQTETDVMEDLDRPAETEADAVAAALEEATKQSSKSDDVRDIINKYVQRVTKFSGGRKLDVEDVSVELIGRSLDICVSRLEIVTSAVNELLDAVNREIEPFDSRLPINVSFFDEECVDLGGPRREFLRCFLQEMGSKLLNENSSELGEVNQNYIDLKYYLIFGLVVGLSVFQGGPVLVLNVWDGVGDHYKQIREGLHRSGLWELMKIKRVYQLMTETVHQNHQVVTLLRIFTTVLSPAGINARKVEESIYCVFVAYCREVYAGRRRPLRLESILRFATGCDFEPLLGFRIKPSINFAETSGNLCTANTCINVLTLPRPKDLISCPRKEIIYQKFDYSFSNDYFGRD